MNEQVFDYLKNACKRQGMTYKDLAQSLDLSEASIKRIFSNRQCSLKQFHELCSALHLQPVEVYEYSKKDQGVYVMSRKEESYFLENYHVFLFYRQLCFSKNVDEVRKRNGLTAKSVKLYLQELQNLGLIRIGQRNKIEFQKSKVIEFPKRGKLLNKIRKEWIPFFIEKTQNEGNSYNHLFEAMSISLSSTSAEKFKLKLLELKEEMFEQAEIDKRSLIEDRGMSFLLAMGPYRMAVDGEIPQL